MLNKAPNKSPGMLRVEENQGERLEILIPRLINGFGVTKAAEELGISKSSLNYWCMKLGIVRQVVALVPGERVEVRGRPRIDGD
jgi:hypothetical protein